MRGIEGIGELKPDFVVLMREQTLGKASDAAEKVVPGEKDKDAGGDAG